MANYLYFRNMSRQGKTNIPTLELCVGGDVVGYLTPFRGYFFQVSQTIDGNCDMGTSRMNRPMSQMFKDVPQSEKIELYKSMVYHAVLKFLSNNYGKDYHPSSKLFDVEPIERFVIASIEWMQKNF